jgi:HK97 family phage portal protein
MRRYPFWSQSLARSEKKAAVLGLSDPLSRILTFAAQDSAASPSSALSLYERSSAVSTPVDMVTDAASVVEPVLFDGESVIRDHPVLDLIRRPSPRINQELFFQVIGRDFLITGEFAVVGLGNINRPPIQLQPISPKNLTPVQADSDFPERWLVSGNELPGAYRLEETPQRVRFLEGNQKELAHVRGYSTQDNSLLRGQSPLLSAAKEVRQHILGTTHNVSLLEKGGRVSLIFHYEADNSWDDNMALADRIEGKFAGAGAAGQIAVTSGGKLDVKELGISPKDMDFATLQKMAIKAVAQRYHVPLPLVIEELATLNNYQEAKLALYDDAALPLLQRLYRGLSDFLLPRFGMDPTQVSLAPDLDSVTALVQRRNEELKQRSSIGIETTNELRGQIGREPIEGGDILYQPANLVPVGSDIFTDDNAPDVVVDEDAEL